MLVQYALRIAGRAAGIAKAARRPLVAFDPAIVAVLRSQPVVEFGFEADIMFDGRQIGLQPLDQRRERCIVDEDAVLGVRDDVGELVVEQSRVDRMENSAGTDDAEPGSEMAVVVHRQGGDAVAGTDADPLQRLSHPARIMGQARPVRADGRPVGAGGDDFAVPCSRSAWSISRMMRSGKSCIAPSVPIRASPQEGASCLKHNSKQAI